MSGNEWYPKRNLTKTFCLDPIDESLLKHVFEEERNRIELKEFEKMLWLPTPEILLATKIKSLPNRTKDNKKTKDLCDIYSLGWYSRKNIDQLKEAMATSLNDMLDFTS